MRAALYIMGGAAALVGAVLAFLVDERLGVLALAAPAAFLVVASPPAGVAVLLFTLPLEEMAGLLPTGSITLKALGLAVIGTWLLHSLVRRRRIAVPGATLALLAFVLWGAASASWAVDPATATHAAATLVQLLFFYLLVVNVLDRPATLRPALLAHVGGAVLLSVFALYLVGSGVLQGGRATIVVGREMLLEPNALAGVLLLPLAICVTGGCDPSRPGGERLSLAAAGLLCLTTILLTMSRGALVGVVLIAVLVSVAARRPWIVPLGLLFALPGLLLAGPALTERLAEGATLADRAAGRLDIWRVGWVIIRSHPLLGVGLGCFPGVYLDYLSQATGISWRHALEVAEGLQRNPHNTFLGTAAELGVIGLGLLLALLAVHLRQAFVGWRTLHARREPAHALLLTGLAGLGALALVGVSCDIANRKAFWLALGLTVLGRGMPARRVPVPQAERWAA